MKAIRPWWSVLPATVLVIGGCEKKEQQQPAPAAAAEVTPAPAAAEPAPAEAPAPEVKALTPGERAAMLGIVGHLAKDTESVLGIYDGKEIVSRLKSLKAWDFINQVASEESGLELEGDADTEGALKFVGREIFLATGKGTAPQFANLIQLQARSNYYQFRILTQALVASMQQEDPSDLEAAGMDSVTAMLSEIGKELPLIESAAMPPVLLGIKAADDESKDVARQQVVSSIENLFTMMDGSATELEFTKAGVEFKGYKLPGTVLAEQLEASREDMEETIEAADVDRLIATLKTKNLVAASGMLGDYLLLYVGDSEEACPLVDKVEDSLAANDAISFVDAYQGKKLVGFVYGEEGLSKAAVTGQLKDLALGIRDGLAGVEGLGDTRELAAMLEAVGDREDALLQLSKSDALGGLIVLEEGVKFELFGGTDRGAYDLDATHHLGGLGGLGGSGDVLFTSSWVTKPEYSDRARAYGEAIIETAYALTEKVSGFEMEDPEFAQFQQFFSMFNETFRTDTVAMWEALSTAGSGLGNEGALVIDLKGEMPPLPSVPQELVDAGRFPRISLVTPVTDRAKLQESWTKLDGSLRNILKSASELAGQDMPMQKPIPSEKNDLTTWFFSMPFFTEDFMPSVTVGDKLFVASTSKLQALDLAAAAANATTDRKGAWAEMDFDVLRKFAGDWLELIEKNGEGVLGGPEQLAAFKEELPRLRKGLAALEEFDQLSYSERIESGKLRTSLHIKTR